MPAPRTVSATVLYQPHGRGYVARSGAIQVTYRPAPLTFCNPNFVRDLVSFGTAWKTFVPSRDYQRDYVDTVASPDAADTLEEYLKKYIYWDEKNHPPKKQTQTAVVRKLSGLFHVIEVETSL